MMPRNQIQKPLFALLLGGMLLAGCGVPNPFCGSARPKPVLTSLAPNPATLTQVQQGLHSLSMAATFTLLPSSYGTERYCPPASLVLPSYRPRLPRPRCRLLVPPKLSCTLLPTSQETSVATAVETARH